MRRRRPLQAHRHHLIVKPEWAGTTYPPAAASAETAISSIAYAATATTAEGPPAAIPAT